MFDQLVELEDYLVDYQTGVVEFLDPVSESQVLAVAFVRQDGSAVGGSDGDTLRLELVSKDDRVVGTAWEPIRRYELKNVYDLGAEDIPEDGFGLEIRKRSPSGEVLDNQDGVPYIQILGLDTHGLGGAPDPDGIVDLEWIDFEKGYLFFPHFTPFCPAYDTTGFYYAPGGGARLLVRGGRAGSQELRRLLRRRSSRRTTTSTSSSSSTTGRGRPSTSAR